MTWKTRPRSDFGCLTAIRSGAGPNILLLHGVGLKAEAWNAQIAMLEQGHCVVAPDMPGHGSSPGHEPLNTLADYTDLVADALTEPVVVVGHSMGAMMAFDLSIRFSDLVLGVAGLNAIYRRSQEATTAVRLRAATLAPDQVSDPQAPLERWFGSNLSAEKEACRQWLTSVNPAGYKAAYNVFAFEDGPKDHDLASLTCPVLLMTGGAEPNSTPQMSQKMAELTPSGRAITIGGAAHMMPMTHPAQVNAELLDFIRECTA